MTTSTPQPVLYYTSTVEQNVINADNQISANTGLPSDKAQYWAIVQKAYNQNLWFIRQPPPDGWNGISQATMIAGVTDVDLQPYNQNWFAPIPWPPEGA